MKIVSTNKAPQAIGPYSQAIIANGMVFTSGQVALNEYGEIVSDDIVEQTHQVLNNLKAVLEAAGSGLDKVVKTTIYLASMDDFATVNEIYATYFDNHRPARSTVAVKTLPLHVSVEMDCIALV